MLSPWLSHRSYSTPSEKPPLSNFNSYRDIPNVPFGIKEFQLIGQTRDLALQKGCVAELLVAMSPIFRPAQFHGPAADGLDLRARETSVPLHQITLKSLHHRVLRISGAQDVEPLDHLRQHDIRVPIDAGVENEIDNHVHGEPNLGDPVARRNLIGRHIEYVVSRGNAADRLKHVELSIAHGIDEGDFPFSSAAFGHFKRRRLTVLAVLPNLEGIPEAAVGDIELRILQMLVDVEVVPMEARLNRDAHRIGGCPTDC